VEPYSLRFRASVEKDLRRIPLKTRRRCLERIDELRTNPRPRTAVQLTGSQHTHRVRVATYRIVYQIDDAEHVVTVEHVRHRKDAYR
jgi:mRNA interferase RelE/StbE